MNKDEMEGKGEKARGKIEEKTGQVIGDPDMEAEGSGEAGEDLGDEIKDE